VQTWREFFSAGLVPRAGAIPAPAFPFVGGKRPMGVMRFLVPPPDHLPADAAARAYFAGIDEIPWQCRVVRSDEGLTLERDESDSGNFYVPYAVDGHGELMLSTGSLMERARPYHLQVELARGTLNRLRNQLAIWESMGMRVPGEIDEPLAASRLHFSRAATRQDDATAAAGEAELSMQSALDANLLLSRAYVQQALAARHQQSGKLGTLWGINIGTHWPSPELGQQLAATFNTVQIPFTWRHIQAREDARNWSTCDAQIEWCRSAGMKVCGGPLLSIDRWSLPDWMYLFSDDAESFRACVAEHVQAVVERYRGRVHLWMCAARLNVGNELEQSEEERLRLAVLAIESVRRADPRAPIVLSIDQPWGTFMSRQECDLSPLHFADALVRAELGLAGIGLEINLGYAALGSEPRDALEFGRQMDRYSTLGLPLLVTLTVPSGQQADPQAQRAAAVVRYDAGDGLSAEAQRAWAEKYLPVLLAKQPVQGIIWNQLLDSRPHELAHGGLFESETRPKPIVELLAALRREHLT
jgi:hypothetical protein